LPSNREIRDPIQLSASFYEGERRTENLRQMRLDALRMMRILRSFRPRLVGSTLTGHVRHGSDIDLHLFSDSVEAVSALLRRHAQGAIVDWNPLHGGGAARVFTFAPLPVPLPGRR
jgi:hypothetical protein